MISKELLSTAKFSYSLHFVKVSATVYIESRLVKHFFLKPKRTQVKRSHGLHRNLAEKTTSLSKESALLLKTAASNFLTAYRILLWARKSLHYGMRQSSYAASCEMFVGTVLFDSEIG